MNDCSKPDTERIRVTIQLSAGLYEQLAAEAYRQRTSVGRVVRCALMEFAASPDSLREAIVRRRSRRP